MLKGALRALKLCRPACFGAPHLCTRFISSVETGDTLRSDDLFLLLGLSRAPGFTSAEPETHCLGQLMFL